MSTNNPPTTGEETPRQAPPLNSLYLYLTEGCNLACRHCWLAPKLDVDGTRFPTLPVPLLETILNEAKPLGLSNAKLTGGEPLLHPEIVKILEIIRREKLTLTIETNGVLCTPELANEIAKSEKRFVSVSIDGTDAKTHEEVRRIPGSFEDACRGVRNLAGASISPQIIMSVMRSNIHQVDDVIRLGEELGASSVKFNIVQPTARGDSMQKAEQTLTVAELIELGTHVDNDLAPMTDLRLHFDFPLAFRPLSRLASRDGCSVCGIFGILGVVASGHYALCGIGQQVPDLVFGMAGEDPLEKVWKQHPKLVELREGLPGRLEGICSRCLMNQRCLGSCVAQNYYRSGSYWAPFWFCEEAEREGLFPMTRTTVIADAG